jgi:hypothetical protein
LQAGFCNVSRVSHFNVGFTDPITKQVFLDSSDLTYKGYFVSLNFVAYTCPSRKLSNVDGFDGFEIKHHALPYYGYKDYGEQLEQYVEGLYKSKTN